MRKFIFTVLVLSLVSCGKGDGSSATVNRSPTSATITTLSDADKDTGSPTLAILGKGGLSLTAGAIVDGLFFGDLYFAAYSYDSTKESPWLGMSLGESHARCLNEQNGLLKKAALVNIEFCVDGGDGPTAGKLNVTSSSLKVIPPPTAVKQGFFKVDFLVTTMRGIGVVSDGKAFVDSIPTALQAHDDNEAVKDLPIQEVKAESRIQIIYARNDLFPKATTVTARKQGDSRYGNLSFDVISPDLDDVQKKIISDLALMLRVGDFDVYTTSIVPMEPSIIDLSSYIGEVDTAPKGSGTEATAASGGIVAGDTSAIAPQAPATDKMITLNICSIYDVNDAMFPSVVLPIVKVGDECTKVGSACPAAHTVNATVYSWASTTAATCRLSASPALQLTSAGIPLGKAKFVMEINFDQILSSGSSLEGDSPSFEFSRVGGVPFGTNMTVTEKLK